MDMTAQQTLTYDLERQLNLLERELPARKEIARIIELIKALPLTEAT